MISVIKEQDINILDELHKYGILIYKSSETELTSEDFTDEKYYLDGFQTDGCYHLEKLFVTKDVRIVNWNGLGRFHFNRFEVDLSNEFFQSVNGVLYTKKGYDRHGDKTRKKMIELVACPTNIISHNVMYGTIRIANCAFKGCHISKITLTNTIKEIGTNAFYFADRIELLEIPMSIQIIESQLARSSFPIRYIRYDNYQFQSWEELFNYMVKHGFEKKNNKVLKII